MTPKKPRNGLLSQRPFVKNLKKRKKMIGMGMGIFYIKKETFSKFGSKKRKDFSSERPRVKGRNLDQSGNVKNLSNLSIFDSMDGGLSKKKRGLRNLHGATQRLPSSKKLSHTPFMKLSKTFLEKFRLFF